MQPSNLHHKHRSIPGWPHRSFPGMLIMTAGLILCLPDLLHAYIGPGAGFALLSSLFTLLITFLFAFFSLITLPVRLLFSFIRGRKAMKKALVRRVVVVGFDGLDPTLCEQYMEAGKLPHFSRLKDEGSYRHLGTTCPALSPVAWSSFSTGVNPARHNIYDFLMRNPNTYLPELSSSRVVPPQKKIRIGKLELPLEKPTVKFLRKSKSFWTILGESSLFSHIIRVPITFPPERFRGALLSAMCTPDIRGTQGTFSFYTTDEARIKTFTSGVALPLKSQGRGFTGRLIGPENTMAADPEPIKLRFELHPAPEDGTATLVLGKTKIKLKEKVFSPWTRVTFRPGMGIRVRGICQFYLKRTEPEVELYVSAIHIDPEKPALPISHPFYYAVYLAKRFGSYGTLGLIEDTWALNENVLDEDAFLDQVNRIHEEREKQFFHAMKKTNRGACVCVFDFTDRIQHMFFRYLVDDHPANREKECDPYRDVIEQTYRKADDLLGRVLERLPGDTLLMVLSDHGFKPFIRGININSWLREHGYLTLMNGDLKSDYLQNVDWEKTQAYSLGLAGIYINLRGREKKGVVEKGEAHRRVKKEIIDKLTGIKDPDTGETAINRIYDAEQVYRGPYRDQAPDLIVGYNSGYRVSWDSAIGKTTDRIFEDNEKNWSGDHGVDPEIVKGVFFSNMKISSEDPNIIDLAPTILHVFGIEVPHYMDGRYLEMPDLDISASGSENKSVRHE